MIPTRKEAVNQMIENRQKITDKNINKILDLIADEIQVAINKGLGYTSISIQGIDSEAISYLKMYLKAKGYHLTFYREQKIVYGFYEFIPKLKIQWDLPWYRRIF